MRINKNIRIACTVAGAAAIAWGAVLAPASADDAPVQTAETASTSSSSTSTTTSTSTTSTSTTIAPTTSTTAVTTPGDPDGDGVSNEPAVDFFDTGVTADQDPTTAIIGQGNDAVIIGLDVEGNEELRSVQLNTAKQAGNVTLPNGFVSFRVVNATTPVDVITLWADKDVKAHQLFKGTASAMTPFPMKDKDFDNGVAAFVHTITDGGAGDSDGAKNGTIVDPVGPGYVNAAAVTTTTAKRNGALPRTGGDMTLPAASGFVAIIVGVLLLGLAWKPNGAHYTFNK